ncbi:MAG TPA: hypothetical protein VMH28_09625 [Candidatus Acidoferrales bacterium]|nr:hypothetical protein [Candidatus Acidoferrales bacterium]
MAKTVSLIGVDPAELRWLRLVIWLLRHPDPNVAELTREAILYLEATSGEPHAEPQALDHAG